MNEPSMSRPSVALPPAWMIPKTSRQRPVPGPTANSNVSPARVMDPVPDPKSSADPAEAAGPAASLGGASPAAGSPSASVPSSAAGATDAAAASVAAGSDGDAVAELSSSPPEQATATIMSMAPSRVSRGHAPPAEMVERISVTVVSIGTIRFPRGSIARPVVSTIVDQVDPSGHRSSGRYRRLRRFATSGSAR